MERSDIIAFISLAFSIGLAIWNWISTRKIRSLERQIAELELKDKIEKEENKKKGDIRAEFVKNPDRSKSSQIVFTNIGICTAKNISVEFKNLNGAIIITDCLPYSILNSGDSFHLIVAISAPFGNNVLNMSVSWDDDFKKSNQKDIALVVG